ncbi:hypothetical protein [Polynucleobacter sp. AP-Kolm-20A-A1]|uniref:hypothetical protein n=1 Tax=Polynucleobacter sp. AP-Kolm-20A-A1 TaxID=2081041 RepID=UPI001BFCD6DB|nr:hypothetical protein [Polynucleobacter sp. AP-Kolm-20A-A1]QWE19908.1 hypothetical protein C2745_05735 [Polynucleobacter sp. AP-Kolm-20A-A1]
MLFARLNNKFSLSLAKRWAFVFSFIGLLLLQGCVAPIAAIGASGTAVASSAGTTAATAAVANPMTATSLASTAATGKSPLEHAASAATKKECSFFNVVGAKPICIDVVLPPVTDKSTPLLGPSDITTETAKQ